jgi:hypothetical protein
MFSYDFTKMQTWMAAVIAANAGNEAHAWLQEQAQHGQDIQRFNTSFAILPRKTGKNIITVEQDQQFLLQQLHPGMQVNGWTMDRFCRVWLIMQLDAADKEKYFNSIENLFRSGAVNELVALYSALPLLAYPTIWKARCAEGIRSNIGDVLEAIMYHNPYPAAQLSEAAWNQLVLKAIFTGKETALITGLDERANKELAYTLSDFAHERWAAHRTVPAQLWRICSRFIDEKLLPDFKKALATGDAATKQVIVSAIAQSNYAPAKVLLEKAG